MGLVAPRAFYCNSTFCHKSPKSHLNQHALCMRRHPLSQLTLNPPKNANYAATVVALSGFKELLKGPGTQACDNVKAAIIMGSQVVVSKDCQAGDVGLFFPPETALSKEFLGANNQYRKAEFGNVNPEATGFFEQHGRVKTMKFRGHKSEGFFIPLESLQFALQDGDFTMLSPGQVFDHINGVEICRKYVPAHNTAKLSTNQPKGKTVKLEDSIVAGQFRLHSDTENLRRNMFKIQPTDVISLTDKWHGTSVVISNILVKREPNWIERLLMKLKVPIMVQNTEYGFAYSSRKVIKAVNGISKHNNHFYSTDIWGIVAKEVESKIPIGFTVYGEIVGYTPDGAFIQKGYHYGCAVGEHQMVVYRVTSTSYDGNVIELSWPQLVEFCEQQGLQTVPEIYYGPVVAFLPHTEETTEEWGSDLLKVLEALFTDDADCPYNDKGTPAEGIVLRVDHLSYVDAFKCKNFRFLKRESDELDTGIVDVETAESEGRVAA
jgi:hypothetical protein